MLVEVGETAQFSKQHAAHAKGALFQQNFMTDKNLCQCRIESVFVEGRWPTILSLFQYCPAFRFEGLFVKKAQKEFRKFKRLKKTAC